jgi:outer membrane protein OmpA-like peptidoglycan-associated protein
MDIYQITYLNKFNKTCREKVNELLTINSKLTDKTTGIVDFEVTMPEKLKPVSYQWTFNQTVLPENTPYFSRKVSNTALGDSIYLSVIATCDTCLEPVKLCGYTRYQKPKEETLAVANEERGTNPYDTKLELPYLGSSAISSLNLNLAPIHFELNKTQISEEAAAIWKKNIEILNQHPELSLLIYGFADSRGSDTYNLPLSKQRAQKIKDYLKANGLKSNRIQQVVGKGESFILNRCLNDVECSDEEHQLNRRVEFILFKKEK